MPSLTRTQYACLQSAEQDYAPDEHGWQRWTARPYKAQERNGYWVAIDKRNGELISYPTTQANAKREATFMNRQYAQVLAEVGAA